MSDTPEAPNTSTADKTASKRPLVVLGALFASIGIGYTAWHLLVGRYHVITDNAYVGGNLVQITPQVAGTIVKIGADDTDRVQAGQLLVQLDPADADVALAQAEADLARTVRDVRMLFANTSSIGAQVTMREADLDRAEADLARARTEYERRLALKGSGAVSGEELSNAETALAAARTQVRAARSAILAAHEQLSANRAQIENTTIANHPNVLRAAAAVRAAYLASSRAGLVAPVSGYVAKRSAQVGTRVQAGTPLMALVPLDEVWVDANFKEAQLAKVRIGQPVALTADLYGSKVEYHGTVAGIGSGTGGAFALLPAQNATGNWIKVVQRVPVRIVLNADELKEHPLRVGLSMEVDVDVHDQSGAQLAEAPRKEAAYTTSVYDEQAAKADALIARIIEDNAGAAHAGTAPASAAKSG